jgi:sec-independent protein translocase protein TatA
MLNIGPQELLLILVIALLVVGPRRLPELGRSIGKGIRELRKAQDEVRKTIQVSLDDDQGRPTFDDRRSAAVRAPNGRTGSGEAGRDVAPESSGSNDTREISKTLGRGLSELRRARAEIERSFRVEVDTRPSSKRKAKATPRPPAGSRDASTEDAGASQQPDGTSGKRTAPE